MTKWPVESFPRMYPRQVVRICISMVNVLPVGRLRLLPYLSSRGHIAAIPSHATTTFIAVVLRKLKLMNFF